MITLLFDIDDTLYDMMIPFQSACHAVLGTQCDAFIEDMFKVFYRHSNRLLEDTQKGHLPIEIMRQKRIQLAAQEFGLTLSDETASSFQISYKENQEKIFISDTVREMLDDCCHHHAAAGIITNGPSGHQWQKALWLGLDHWFLREQVIISGDVGVDKPHVDIFRHVSEKLQLSGKEVWYVGDTFANDIVGPSQIGRASCRERV